MTETRKNIGNIKTTIGLQTNETVQDLLEDYVEESSVIDDIDDATSNNVILGALATKEAINSKASSIDIPTNTSDLVNDGDGTNPFLTQHQSLDGKVDKVTGKGLSSNDYTTVEKEKLAGIDVGANNYVHPTYTAKNDGLYKIGVDATGHVSSAEPVAKTDITNLGIPAQDTTYSEATESDAGLMSAIDKSKLENIADGANNYSHPSYTSMSKGLYKVAVDNTGHVSDASAVEKTDITSLGIPAQDTTYDNATTTTAGLMSSTDKTKLDGLQNTIVDSELSSSSTNPVQNRVVNGLATRISALESASLSIYVLGPNEDLPQTGAVNKIYFVPNTEQGDNAYDEWVWTGTDYEVVGTTTLELSNYAKISELKDHIGGEITSTGDLNLIFS